MSRFTLADQRSLHYHESGDAGTPVVLLHGYLDSHVSFFRLFDALAAAHRVFAPDLRGHGESSGAADYTVAGFTGDVIALIDGLGVGPVHLGGHSLGGIVAQRVAAARPELVRSLALISTARSAGGSAGLRETVPLLADLTDPVPEALAREFQGSTTFAPLPEDIFARYLDETRKVRADVWRGALAGLVEEPEPREPLSAMPTLILWGREDGLFNAADQEALRAHYTRAKFIAYPGAGHAPNWERPEAVAADLLDFWRGLGDQAAAGGAIAP